MILHLIVVITEQLRSGKRGTSRSTTDSSSNSQIWITSSAGLEKGRRPRQRTRARRPLPPPTAGRTVRRRRSREQGGTSGQRQLFVAFFQSSAILPRHCSTPARFASKQNSARQCRKQDLSQQNVVSELTPHPVESQYSLRWRAANQRRVDTSL